MNITFPSTALDNQSIKMKPLSSYLRSEQRNVSSWTSFLRKYRWNMHTFNVVEIWTRISSQECSGKCISGSMAISTFINCLTCLFRAPWPRYEEGGAGVGEREASTGSGKKMEQHREWAMNFGFRFPFFIFSFPVPFLVTLRSEGCGRHLEASNLKSLKCFNISVSLWNNFPFLERNFREACWLNRLPSIS